IRSRLRSRSVATRKQGDLHVALALDIIWIGRPQLVRRICRCYERRPRSIDCELQLGFVGCSPPNQGRCPEGAWACALCAPAGAKVRGSAAIGAGMFGARFFLGGMGDISARKKRERSAQEARRAAPLVFDDLGCLVAASSGILLEADRLLVEQAPHGVLEGGLAYLGDLCLALVNELGRSAMRAALAVEASRQREPSQDLKEDVLGPTFGLRPFRRRLAVLAWELPRH